MSPEPSTAAGPSKSVTRESLAEALAAAHVAGVIGPRTAAGLAGDIFDAIAIGRVPQPPLPPSYHNVNCGTHRGHDCTCVEAEARAPLEAALRKHRLMLPPHPHGFYSGSALCSCDDFQWDTAAAEWYPSSEPGPLPALWEDWWDHALTAATAALTDTAAPSSSEDGAGVLPTSKPASGGRGARRAGLRPMLVEDEA